MTDAPQCDVFLSYSAGDTPWVREFATALRDAGLSGWFDAADVDFGDRWLDSMEQALRTSRALVVVLSLASANTPWTFFQFGAALADHKQIVPVLAEDMAPADIPQFFRKYPFVQESSPRTAAQRVATSLQPTCA